MRFAIAILVSTLVVACASSSVYRSAESERDVGYRETRLTETQYRVAFRGRRSTPADEVRDFALLRAAEVTLQNGYDWFEVVSSNTDTQARERLSASTDMVPTHHVSRSCGLLGCTTAVHSGYVGVHVMTTETDSYHTSAVEFTMGKGKPNNPSRVYNAAELASSIRASRLDSA
jgi:hypothetical protein